MAHSASRASSWGHERFRDLTACGGCPVHCRPRELCDFRVATFLQKIERFAEGGMDGGLTKATMRKACGLPVEDVALHPDGAGHGVAPRPGAGVVDTVAARQVPGWLLGDEEGLVQYHVSLAKHCLERGWDFCSEHHVSRLHQDVWSRVPTVWGPQLKARGWWKESPPRGRRR